MVLFLSYEWETGTVGHIQHYQLHKTLIAVSKRNEDMHNEPEEE